MSVPPTPPPIAARRRQNSLRDQLQQQILLHLQILISTLGQLADRPFSTFMTTLVIAIALTLPTGLNLMVQNGQALLQNWKSASQITLFLQPSVTEKQAETLAAQLRQRTDVATAEFLSREAALAEFTQYSDLGSAVEALGQNPLPHLILITPTLLTTQDHLQIKRLTEQLATLTEVEQAQLDMEWIERLVALMAVGERIVSVLTIFLSLTVLLVVGNTIRLTIHHRREEIQITQIIGATHAFIQRPFLYTGFWYGLLGGLIAVILVESLLHLIQGPLGELAALYQSSFTLQGLSFGSLIQLLTLSALLGLLGSGIAVNYHLKEVEKIK